MKREEDENMLYITKGAGSQKWMNNETMSPKSSPHRPTERAHNIVLICNNYLHYNELHSPCFIDDGKGEKWVEKKWEMSRRKADEYDGMEIGRKQSKSFVYEKRKEM